jgi:nucleoside 2-deoxyribosyltransferase
LSSSIYLAAPIIGSRDLESANAIARIIRNLGYKMVSEWVVAQDPGLNLSPKAVYQRDTKGVSSCDVLVAEASAPSHGVGMEMMLAHMLGKKVICVCRRGTRLSRLIIGMPDIRIIEYDSFDALCSALRVALV